jgi:hypothetical protein
MLTSAMVVLALITFAAMLRAGTFLRPYDRRIHCRRLSPSSSRLRRASLLGHYMARVFTGEATWLEVAGGSSPVCGDQLIDVLIVALKLA